MHGGFLVRKGGMMTRSNAREMGTDADMLEYALEVGDTYNVRLKVEVMPLSRPSGKSTHAVCVRAYTRQGKPIGEIEREQCYFPGGTSRTFAGAAIYLLTRMAGVLDEWSVRKQREQEQWEPGTLTPLEEYIAGSFTS
jgi:hypothetical protein